MYTKHIVIYEINMENMQHKNDFSLFLLKTIQLLILACQLGNHRYCYDVDNVYLEDPNSKTPNQTLTYPKSSAIKVHLADFATKT